MVDQVHKWNGCMWGERSQGWIWMREGGWVSVFGCVGVVVSVWVLGHWWWFSQRLVWTVSTFHTSPILLS